MCTTPTRFMSFYLFSLVVAALHTAAAVTLTVDGAPGVVGTFAFPSTHTYVITHDAYTITFDRDDLVPTGWDTVSITAVSLVVNGTEIGHNLNGEAPRDPDGHHSFYIDAGGGTSRLTCTAVTVVAVSPDSVELAFIDDTSTPLQHEHHLVFRDGVSGVYGFDVLTTTAATTINEVRVNVRLDRGLLDHTYTTERGMGQQPTYAYLMTQDKISDETWRVNGSNAPGLPFPSSNGANLPRGYAYTKYDWALYAANNVLWGHYGEAGVVRALGCVSTWAEVGGIHPSRLKSRPPPPPSPPVSPFPPQGPGSACSWCPSAASPLTLVVPRMGWGRSTRISLCTRTRSYSTTFPLTTLACLFTPFPMVLKDSMAPGFTSL